MPFVPTAAIAELIGGHIDAVCVNLPTFKSYTPNGDVRLLTVTGEERDSNYPDVPTFKELGYDFDASVYFCIAAPDGLNPEIITILPFHFGAIPGLTVTTALAMFTHPLPELVFPMYLLCLGYPESIPEQRPRLDTRFIFDTDAYPALPTAAELQEYDTEVSQYFFRTTNGRSDRGWVARTQHAIEVKPRYSVGKFLEQSGFLTQTAPAEC
ncbi:MAG: hypothetical protein LUD54_06900 [Oscillospiraceae bacterium]|nr:hypothetical protein [Oscillospiraceae bacterium]